MLTGIRRLVELAIDMVGIFTKEGIRSAYAGPMVFGQMPPENTISIVYVSTDRRFPAAIAYPNLVVSHIACDEQAFLWSVAWHSLPVDMLREFAILGIERGYILNEYGLWKNKSIVTSDPTMICDVLSINLPVEIQRYLRSFNESHPEPIEEVSCAAPLESDVEVYESDDQVTHPEPTKYEVVSQPLLDEDDFDNDALHERQPITEENLEHFIEKYNPDEAAMTRFLMEMYNHNWIIDPPGLRIQSISTQALYAIGLKNVGVILARSKK